MAIAHLRITAISRRQGHSTLAKAAYQSGTRLTAEADALDYRRHARCVVLDELIADTPATRAAFWQAVEGAEKRKDACTGRALEASLPKELTREQQTALARDFTHALLARWNLHGADLAIHAPTPYAPRKKRSKRTENPHLHLLIPDRDRQGKKLPWSRAPEVVKEIRQLWQTHVNAALETAGLDARIDMRSATDQAAEASAETARIRAQIAALERQLEEVEHGRARNELGHDEPGAEKQIDHQLVQQGVQDGNGSETHNGHLETACNLDSRPAQGHQLSVGQARRPADAGRVAGTGGNPQEHQEDRQRSGSSLGGSVSETESGQQWLHTISAQNVTDFGPLDVGARIASRIDGIRIQRSARWSEIADIGTRLADRIDALRMKRSQQLAQANGTWTEHQERLRYDQAQGPKLG